MLTVFDKSITRPPEELGLSSSIGLSKTRERILESFQSSRAEATLSNLANRNFMALAGDGESSEHPRSIIVIDDVFCLFVGTLENTSDLTRHYGLQKRATEAIVVGEAYKRWRTLPN